MIPPIFATFHIANYHARFILTPMVRKSISESRKTQPAGKPSVLVDTRVIYCGDNLDQLKKFPDQCIDLIYIDPPFNSNRNYEVFWGETKEKRSFEDRHASTHAYIDFMRELGDQNDVWTGPYKFFPSPQSRLDPALQQKAFSLIRPQSPRLSCRQFKRFRKNYQRQPAG